MLTFAELVFLPVSMVSSAQVVHVLEGGKEHAQVVHSFQIMLMYWSRCGC